jgi:hypothetical protein
MKKIPLLLVLGSLVPFSAFCQNLQEIWDIRLKINLRLLLATD